MEQCSVTVIVLGNQGMRLLSSVDLLHFEITKGTHSNAGLRLKWKEVYFTSELGLEAKRDKQWAFD